MRRREFIALVGGAAAAWPLAAHAQQQLIPVIGSLNLGSENAFTAQTEGFRRGLSEISYFEGRNVTIEYQWAEGHYDRLPALAADLVQRQVTVIAALGSSEPARAAKAASSTIPIVFQTGGDPIEDGLVASMNRPDGNITGVSRMNLATDPKRLEVLHEVVPNVSVVASLVNPSSPRSASQVRQIEDAARSLSLKLQIVNVGAASDLEGAFATMRQAGAGALLLATDPSLNAMQKQIAELAVRYAIPTMSASRDFVSRGGLMSYGASLSDSFRQAGIYTGRILKGEKPRDLPILQPTKFDLVISLKTAKAIGIEIPPKIIALADEVIE
jgi:putative ABC transport system substrate-binding protein